MRKTLLRGKKALSAWLVNLLVILCKAIRKGQFTGGKRLVKFYFLSIIEMAVFVNGLY